MASMAATHDNASPAASPHLFVRIYDLGQRLAAALEAERLESAAALLQERDLLVARLEAFDHPSEIDSSWKQWRHRLAAQHETLVEALTALSHHTTDTRQHVETLSHAHRKYGASHVSPSGVLHPNFSA